MLSLTQVAKELNVVTDTLTTWYKWWNDQTESPKGCPGLPERCREGNRLYWREEDIDQLKAFKDWVPKGRAGVMGQYNKWRWTKNESNG